MAVSKISISPEASKWFREGMGVPEGGGVHFSAGFTVKPTPTKGSQPG